MQCKAYRWDDIDRDFIPTDENTPRFTAEEIGMSGRPLERFTIPVPPVFIVIRGDREYAVRTEGAPYARYISRLK